jgi:hypothetical protein
LGAKTVDIEDQPHMEEVEPHWKSLCKKVHYEKAQWIKREEKENTNNVNWIPIGIKETTSFLSKGHNWKSPGNDRLSNYWLEAFPATHSHITKIFNT